MIVNDVLDSGPRRKARKRVGRGIGSGWGKTCGKGTKGQNCRSGTGGKLGHEGGTMPLFRRLPRRGFNNTRFRGVPFAIVNVEQLNRSFEAGETVNLELLRERGLVKKNASRVKILGQGELTKALTLQVDAVSSAARAKIESASGSIES